MSSRTRTISRKSEPDPARQNINPTKSEYLGFFVHPEYISIDVLQYLLKKYG